MTTARWAALSGLGLALALGISAAEPTPGGAEGQAATGGAATALSLEGRLVPADAAPIALWLEAYRGELLVLEAVPNGTYVNAGDVLIRFDLETIDEQIRQAEFDLAQAELAFAAAREEERLDDEAARDEVTRASREAEWAARRLQGYLGPEQAFRDEELRLRRQSTQHNLEDQGDELKQLEQMYREDELVDATEAIVHMRARRRLAQSTAWADLGRQRDDYTIGHDEVMRREGLELESAQKQAALERRRRSAELREERCAAGEARGRFDLDKQRNGLEELRRDRAALGVRAPRGGLVLHGEAGAAPGSALLERGGRAPLFKTIMTVAAPEALLVVAEVPEGSLSGALGAGGEAVEVTVAAAPGYVAVGRLTVAALPTSRKGEENQYRAEVSLDRRDPRLKPGMRCTVTAAGGGDARAVARIPGEGGS